MTNGFTAAKQANTGEMRFHEQAGASEGEDADLSGCSAALCLSDISVRLAAGADEVRAAQKLRYQVFYEEGGARADGNALFEQSDLDAFDDIADHLIVIDRRRAAAGLNHGVVGNYRLLRGNARPRGRDFYSSGEFDIDVLLQTDARLLELGRSCVLREYRHCSVLQLMWTALAKYVGEHDIELMFGCASFHGTDAGRIQEQLAYLHHYHLAPQALQPHAIGGETLPMDRLDRQDIDPLRALKGLEPLIRGYLRLGAVVGRGAHVDRQFNTIDVCMILPTAALSKRHMRRFEREGRFQLRSVTVDHSPAVADIVPVLPSIA